MSAHISPLRVLAAFLTAPLAPCLIATVAAGHALWLLVFAPFAYALTLAAGIPAYFLFRHFGWIKIWQIVPVGASLGSLIAVAPGMGQVTLHNLLLSVAEGSSAALVFWLVAFAGARPNNSFKPKPLRGSA